MVPLNWYIMVKRYNVLHWHVWLPDKANHAPVLPEHIGYTGVSGFFSKDEILWRTISLHTPEGTIVWMLATAAVLMTAFYSFRVVFLTFYWISDNILNKLTDRTLVEGIVNGIPSVINWIGGRLRLLQTGIVSHYTMIMATGLMIMAFYVLFSLFRTL
ncbi:conserved hypothetical protein, membrane [Candidatus Magnetobacterium bavaricum]|uniref:Uncharacterized protein n=1 Tax=Candidatus Magnetobacterium bavaricum TaxID=29290 RepID=A0A0F3GYP8_9BACT|nr:conserved hypothetical protein, membrane [Candidatus Magnetobacterium bavaricum]